MNKRDNRRSLDWVHFSCGAVAGAFEGARIAFAIFLHWWFIALVIVGSAVMLGLFTGYGGNDAWEFLSLFDWL